MAKKILQITSSTSKNSGVMSVIMNYYRNIDTKKIQFDFLAIKASNYSYENEIKKLGGRVFITPPIKKLYSFLKYINEFFKEHNDYLAVHLHTAWLNVLIFPIAKRNGINNTIIHSHTTKYSDKKISGLRNKILCIPLKKNSTHLIACSNVAAEFWYGKKSVVKGEVYILNNAIDLEKFQYSLNAREKVRKELRILDKFVVGHVGRFNEPKNHEFLIKIFVEVLKKDKDALLILVGEGPLRKDIEKMVTENEIENKVLFLGARNDVDYLMQGMDVFLLPSLYEGLPVIGVEAQAAGLPCIISDTVTKEIVLTELVRFCSLNTHPSKWADIVLETKKYDKRPNTTRSITEEGYNIKSESHKLEEFYLSL